MPMTNSIPKTKYFSFCPLTRASAVDEKANPKAPKGTIPNSTFRPDSLPAQKQPTPIPIAVARNRYPL